MRLPGLRRATAHTTGLGSRVPPPHGVLVRGVSSLGRLALLLAQLACGACATTPGTVDRIDGSESWRGRYVHALAYAWYARGAHYEARGQLEEAETAFGQAVQHDPKSGSSWARLGAVRCALATPELAAEAFARGLDTGNETAVVLIARGECALGAGRAEAALEDGRAAVARAPRSLDASLLVIDALLALERQEEAVRWLDALSALSPGAHRVQTRRITEARKLRDPSRERRAHELRFASLSAQALEAHAEDPELATGGKEAIDAAVSAGRLALAIERATHLGMSKGELALRAVALGRSELGREVATLVLDADPGDLDSRLALWISTDLLEGTPPADLENVDVIAGGPLHPLGVLLFAELLDRRVGTEAASAWRRAFALDRSSDRLVEEVRARIERAGESQATELGASSP